MFDSAGRPQNPSPKPLLAYAERISRAFRLAYDDLRFAIESARGSSMEVSIIQGVPTRLVADSVLREQPTRDSTAIDLPIAGSRVTVYPLETARPGWVLARLSNGLLGFLFVVHVDMREARRLMHERLTREAAEQAAAREAAALEVVAPLTAEAARKLDLAEVLERDPAEIDRVLDVLLGVSSS
jgi:hypothetical protein